MPDPGGSASQKYNDLMKILVVEVSALHLGFLGCYGNDWVATPNLDRLAAESIVFDQHFADRPESSIAANTCRYGFPSADQVPGDACQDILVHRESIELLKGFGAAAVRAIERSRQQNHTILWIDGPSLAPPWRLPAKVLGSYVDDEAGDEEQSPPLASPDVGLHYVAEADLDRLHAAYAGVVSYFDTQIGRVLDHLRKKKRSEGLLVCVTSRCGLPLAEHAMTGLARAWLHDETVHVPLLLRLPEAANAGERIAALTQPIDLVPTLREYLGLVPMPAHGQSLWPLMRGGIDEIRPYALSGLRIDDSEEWLLRTPDFAFLLPISVPAADPPRRPQLYAKPDDRWEVNDLAPRHEEYTELLEKTLRQVVAATHQPGALVYPPLPQEFPAASVELP
jgi:hypothetical protein